MGSITKVCSVCKVEKELSDFKKDKRKLFFAAAICKECANKKNSEYQKQNKEVVNSKTKRHYYKNLEKSRERVKLYTKENKEKIYKREKEYYKNNPEKGIEKAKRWRDANKEKVRNQHNVRRSRMENAEGTLSKEEWQSVLDLHKNKCVYCGKRADTQDHLIPISKGGSHTIENVVPACRSCNSRKNSSSLLMFLYRMIKG